MNQVTEFDEDDLDALHDLQELKQLVRQREAEAKQETRIWGSL